MVKQILIFVVILVNFSNAQFLKSYGIKLGVTNSNEEWKYTNDELGNFQMDSKQGLNIGAFAEFLDLPIVNLITEIGYTQKGMEDNFAVTSTGNPEGTGEFKTVTNRVDYLNLSLALKANYTMPIVTPYLYAGPRIDFLIMTDVDKGFKIVYDEYEKVVYGLKIGLGTEIMKILPVSILAEFQYNYDLSDSYKTDLLKINNNSYELKIGIIL